MASLCKFPTFAFTIPGIPGLPPFPSFPPDFGISIDFVMPSCPLD